MTPTLLFVISGLLFFIARQQHQHHFAMLELMRNAVPEHTPLKYSELVRDVTEPFPLIIRKGAGWGTLMDLSPTKEYRPGRLPSFTIREFGGYWGVPLDIPGVRC